jgi:hypothetical protein
LGATKLPFSEVVTVRVTPLAGFATVTVAFARKAPLGSFAVPKIVPDVTCDSAFPPQRNTNRTDRTEYLRKVPGPLWTRFAVVIGGLPRGLVGTGPGIITPF